MRYHCYKNIAKLMNEESFEWKDFWDGFIAITNSCTYKAAIPSRIGGDGCENSYGDYQAFIILGNRCRQWI